jgi:hypothetical protein
MNGSSPPLLRIALGLAVASLILPGCTEGGSSGGPGGSNDEALTDTDGDGLVDDFEAEIGTDPALDDTDGDGFLDGDEWSAFSDPLDETDFEYAGDYDHFPYPDDLAGTGFQVGDTVSDFALSDFHEQLVGLYTFYGNVIHVVSAADW